MMMEVYCRMLNQGDDNYPEKCRERRRRRIQMRRLASLSAAGSGQPVGAHGLSEATSEEPESVREGKRFRGGDRICVASSSSGDEGETEATPADAASGGPSEPVFGTMSISGRSREMEDAIDVQTGLCRPEIFERRRVHFFGVFDGHGGHHVAALCSLKMHVFLEEELMRVGSTVDGESWAGSSSSQRPSERSEAQRKEKWREVISRTFQRTDELALNTCACGSVGSQCGCHPVEAALAGSTAVVAVLTPDHIVVANCGDSRAVLCRGGRAIPLSRDHKPDRLDELTRIEAAGGRVIYVNGARVEGILAMSRAIGDRYLKPVVSSEPETTITRRDPMDECLILASDGLWDVLSSDLACEVACRCLREGDSTDMNLNSRPQSEEERSLYPSRSMLAAALLTRLALGRKSSDNISVIVIDLKNS